LPAHAVGPKRRIGCAAEAWETQQLFAPAQAFANEYDRFADIVGGSERGEPGVSEETVLAGFVRRLPLGNRAHQSGGVECS
jgi:hypothetical protein